MIKWKCDTCKNQHFESEYNMLVCLKNKWAGDGDGDVSEEYKNNNPDPWIDCNYYEKEDK